MRKKLFPFFVYGIICLCGCFLSGCEETEVPVVKQTVRLEFYNRKREVYEIMEKIISDFNESQNDIEVTQTMNSNADVALRMGAARGEFPDIVLLSGLQNTQTTEYIMGGNLIPLDDMECTKRIHEKYIPYLTCDGHIYQLPLALGFEGIYVNHGLFKAAGLEVPSTYEELCAVCEEIQAMGGVPFIFADTEGWTVHQNWESIMSVSTDNFGSIFTEIASGNTTFWDHEISRTSMEKLIELHQYTSEEYQKLNYDEAMNRFAEGKAFMFMQGSWAYRNIKQQNSHLELEMIPFPAEENKEQHVTLWVDSCVAISNDCEYPEAAKIFLEYLMRPEVLQLYLDDEGTIGCMEATQMVCEYAPRVNEFILSGTENMDATWLPIQTSIIRDQDIASLMPYAGEKEIQKYMDLLTKSLQRHSEQFLEVKERIG